MREEDYEPLSEHSYRLFASQLADWVMGDNPDPDVLSGAGKPSPEAYHKDAGKPAVDLIPPEFILGVAKVLTYGNDKYGPRNWEEHADHWKWGQLIASCMRHILAWQGGEDEDPESGLPHLYHAGCNLAMLSELQRVNRGEDDRSCL